MARLIFGSEDQAEPRRVTFTKLFKPSAEPSQNLTNFWSMWFLSYTEKERRHPNPIMGENGNFHYIMLLQISL
jgi:hypothetical protein